ncbi:hypothetical protein [Methylobacterium sp. Leaf91]|uniref:hypothetical protein n=1 Tax=Methylobacterium sp. Leaf91 TaxID=1736247 RepID=UPI000B134B17|nr:hypothetical protein [Methylobacterium sp. Leaf91]
MAVRLDSAAFPSAPEASPGGDVTPTKGYSFATSKGSGESVKVSGSSGNDVITISDLQKDSDQVINTGSGNDLFRWNGAEGARAGADTFDTNGNLLLKATEDVNGIVKFGDKQTDGLGDNDQVYLANQISDYEFTLRSDGGIKIHYIGTTDGAAVTFYGAESFTFRNIDPVTGDNNKTFSLDYAELRDLIDAADGVPLPTDMIFGV